MSNAEKLARIHENDFIQPRSYIKLTPCDFTGEPQPEQVIYVRSHDDILTPAEQTATNMTLSRESVTSQSVNYQTSNSTISTFNFSILEENDAITRYIKNQPGCTLAGYLVEFYCGDATLHASQYVLLTTQTLRSYQQQNDEYHFAARGIAVDLETEVFDELCFPLWGDIFTEGNLSAPVCESREWLKDDDDTVGTPRGLLRLLGTSQSLPQPNGDFIFKVDTQGSCEYLRTEFVEKRATPLFAEGEVVRGYFAVANTGNQTIPAGAVKFSAAASGTTIIGASVRSPAIAPGAIWFSDTNAVGWQRTVTGKDVLDNEESPLTIGRNTDIGAGADVVDASLGSAIATVEINGIENSSGASGRFDSQQFGRPTIADFNDSGGDISFDLKMFWNLPAGDIQCGGGSRPRVSESVYVYRVLERGFLNTQVEPVDPDNGQIFSDGDSFCAAPIIEGRVPEIIWAVLTGYIYDEREFFAKVNPYFRNEDGEPWPGYSGLVNADLLDHSSFSIEALPEIWSLPELQFVCPSPDQLNEFVELELMRWSGHFLREEPNGTRTLQPLPRAGAQATKLTINHDNAFQIDQITVDWERPTGLFLAWDKNPCADNFLSGTGISNETAVADRCGERSSDYCAFSGVQTSSSSGPVVRNHMREFLSYISVPRGGLITQVCMSAALRLRVGDTITLDTDRLKDPLSKTPGRFRRNLGVSEIRYDCSEGQARIRLEGALKDPYPITDWELAGEPCSSAEEFMEGRIPLPLGNGQTIKLEAGQHYYHIGDLTLNVPIELSGRGTLGLAVYGTLRLGPNFTLDGTGYGLAGEAGHNQIDPPAQVARLGMGSSTGGTGYRALYNTGAGEGEGGEGNNNSSASDGGVFKGAGTVTLDNESTVSYQCITRLAGESQVVGRELNFGTPNSPSDLLNYELAGNGGAGGARAELIDIARGGGTRFIQGADGGDGGMGLYILTNYIEIDDNVQIILDGDRGGKLREAFGPNTRTAFVSPQGAGGNAGRFLLVLNGGDPNFTAAPRTYVRQRFGGGSTLPDGSFNSCSDNIQTAFDEQNAAGERILNCV